jgi:hypothetical protein
MNAEMVGLFVEVACFEPLAIDLALCFNSLTTPKKL